MPTTARKIFSAPRSGRVFSRCASAGATAAAAAAGTACARDMRLDAHATPASPSSFFGRALGAYYPNASSDINNVEIYYELFVDTRAR